MLVPGSDFKSDGERGNAFPAGSIPVRFRQNLILAGPHDWPHLVRTFGPALIELDEEDARRYAANSFTYTPPGQTSESYLVMPDGVSERLLDRVRDCDVTPVSVDVSEFLEKGGGSVKCMIGDLGVVEEESAA